ncbi:MAG: hypothetical protein PX635_19240 [Nostocales cyanobacterium LE14-WE12]|jgi:hypothetical protein|nr:hypothetical protein [Nostocales cyanobacterium LE14-WE12]
MTYILNNGELTWFRIIGQNWYGETCTMEIELNKYDIEELENLGLGLGESEKEAREVINQWLLAADIYDPQGFWNDVLSSVTDYDCQIELSDGRYVSVDWEDDENDAKYQENWLNWLDSEFEYWDTMYGDEE